MSFRGTEEFVLEELAERKKLLKNLEVAICRLDVPKAIPSPLCWTKAFTDPT